MYIAFVDCICMEDVLYDMQTLHAGGIPMFRGTYLVLNVFGDTLLLIVDCICMEDVWHVNLTCRGHPHVPRPMFRGTYLVLYRDRYLYLDCSLIFWQRN